MASSSNEFLIADAKYATPLDLTATTVVITGGSTGLGFHLAKRFLASGSTVIITGRRLEQLEDAKKQLSSSNLHIKQSDVAKQSDREELAAWAIKTFPKVNGLINNAGITRNNGLAGDKAAWSERASEIEINLNGPIHLTQLFTGHFLSLSTPSFFANVTSGLAFTPFVADPIYSATKAGLHSFTMAQRWSFEKTKVRVIEIVPPAVKTNIGGGLGGGEDPDEWADSTFKRFVAGEVEIGFKSSDDRRHASRVELDKAFTNMSPFIQKTFSVAQY